MHNRNTSTSYRTFQRIPVENALQYDMIIGALDAPIKEPYQFSQTFNAEPSPIIQTNKTETINRIPSHWSKLHGIEFRDKFTPLRAQEHFWYWWFNRPAQCKCQDALQILESMGGLCFNSEKEYFESGIHFHNLINKKLASEYPNLIYEQMNLEDAYCMWKAVFPHKHKKALVTIATGQDYKVLLKYSSISHRKYAERIGADYIQLTNQVYQQWQLDKFRAGIVAKAYDNTIFVDADVFITDSCPDISLLGDLVIHDDFHKLTSKDWLINESETIAKSQDIVPWEVTRCLNTGFVACTKENNPWIAPSKLLPDTHCAEQIWVDYQIKEYTSMPTQLHWQYWFEDFWQGLEEAQTIHFANAPNAKRIEMMKDLTEGYSIKDFVIKYT